MLVTISLSIAIFVLLIEFWKVYLNKTKLSAFYHVKGWPVLGKALDLIGKNNEQIFDMFATKTDKLSYAWFGTTRIFHVARPEDCQAILTSDKCLKKAFPYDFLYNQTGIMTSEPSIWKEHRRALNPTLGPKMINSFLPIFNEKFKKMVDLMEKQLGENIDMHHTMFKASIETTLRASFGVNFTMQNRRGDEIRKIIMSLMESIQLRIQRIWLWNPIYNFTQDCIDERANFNRFYRFIRSVLETKRMNLAENWENGEDELKVTKENYNQNYLQKCLQLESEQKWNDQNVCEEMDTIFVGSVDTSATTLCGISLMLAIHQEYQDQVVQELHEIFEDANEIVTNEHLTRMTFLDLVIKESIRYFPVAPFIGRECTADVEINGGIIPKGSQIFINVFRMNKNPKFWGENVQKYYPERFLPENCADQHPYLYIPFSAGPRNCIGSRYAWASLKIALAYILRRYKLTTDLKMDDIIIKPELLLKIGNENSVKIEQRKWCSK